MTYVLVCHLIMVRLKGYTSNTLVHSSNMLVRLKGYPSNPLVHPSNILVHLKGFANKLHTKSGPKQYHTF